ncbi:hypothetical protein ACNQVK_24715 [Mycobacterium sp. 134]|uniref:hypothetical protein n=1 Tax=Mycobacterium sp. 134 TaxID=3400425 RepID=UPI003AAD6B99
MTVAETGERHIQLSPDALQRCSEPDQDDEPPRGLSINAEPWIQPVFPPPRSHGMVVRGGRDEIKLAARGGSSASWSVELIGPRTPRRLLVVPPMPAGDHYRLLWYRPGELVPRPRIEPTDGGGQLLMGYLLNGQYALAAAAARTLERVRGDADPMTWVAPSYTQLLIGYAYALGRDCARLTSWCRRTAAATELGSDGLVLAAEAAWQREEPTLTRELLASAADLPPPTITLGGELALDRATSLSLELGRPAVSDRHEARAQTNVAHSSHEAMMPPNLAPAYDAHAVGGQPLHVQPKLDDAVQALSNRWTTALMRADGRSLSLSIATSQLMSPDLGQAPRVARLRWLLRYFISRIRYTAVRTRPVLFAFSKEMMMSAYSEEVAMTGAGKMSGESRSKDRSPLWVAAAAFWALVLVLGFAWATDRAGWQVGPVVWLAEGAVLALVLVAIGAFAGALVYRDRLAAAEVRALDAEYEARRFHMEAMKGRALAAVLEADGRVLDELGDSTAEVRAAYLRHMTVARELFD